MSIITTAIAHDSICQKGEEWLFHGMSHGKTENSDLGCCVFFVAALVATLLISGCNDATRVFDSEISAINRQTEVLQQQNQILERIAAALAKEGDAE